MEVGGEDFDAGTGGLLADLLDDRDEGLRGAEVVVVAVDAGDDGVGEAELCDRVGYAARFVVVDGLGLALGDGAEAAATGAEVAEHHEGGGLLVPALADVRAVGGLADGVQVQVAGELLQRVEGLAARGFGFEPGGLGGRLRRGEIDLDEFCSGRHWIIVRLYGLLARLPCRTGVLMPGGTTGPSARPSWILGRLRRGGKR